MGEIAGRGRIIETLQIVWRTEYWGDTAPTIGTVPGGIVAVTVVREAVVRVGHPARVTEGCRHHTLEYRLRSQYDLVRDIEARLRTTKRHNRDTDLKQRFERENRKLDLQISECLEEASVVLGTLITCGEGSYHYTKY